MANAETLSEPRDKPLPKAARFRIFWHIGTQIEQIADAAGNPSAMADLRQARDAVDGYYMLGGMVGGSLGYWPARPRECLLNFKRLSDGESHSIAGETREFDGGGTALRAECQSKLWDSFSGQEDALSSGDVVRLQAEAFSRAAKVLELTDEDKLGKQFIVPVLFKSPEFSYEAQEDTLRLLNIPSAYCGLVKLGVTPDKLMLYQEYRSKNSVRIPRAAGQKPSNADFLPQNLKALTLVETAFDEAGLPLGGVNLNFRSWTGPMQKAVSQMHGNRSAEGVNFEVSPRLLEARTRTINRIADGMNWILDNTAHEITVLIPGYWPDADIATEQGIDFLGDRTRRLIATLDKRMRANTGRSEGVSPLCSQRIAFIPASYGAPIHPGTLPATRDGKWAGTVTGQIGLLNEMRKELCRT